MARKPVSVFRRPMTRKGQFRYYIQVWVPEKGHYSVARSAFSLLHELDLDEKQFPPTSKTGALLIGQELIKRGNTRFRKADPCYADYCAEIWSWERSPYIQGKLARGQRIGQEYVGHNARYVENYIRPSFPNIRLSSIKSYMLEDLALGLKKDSTLSNQSINAILIAATVPLSEAFRLGYISSNPAKGIRKLGTDKTEKGIPSEDEIHRLIAIPELDPRIRAAILLGAACALRIGEIQALRLRDIGETFISIEHSWGKIEGLKSTKTERARIVPLPQSVRTFLIKLTENHPHDRDGFIIYGSQPEAPLDVRAIERGFYGALLKIGITEDERQFRRITFHSLRHWANAMLRGSLSDSKLRLLTGHSTAAMTQHYDHVTQSDLLEVAAAQEKRILPYLESSVLLAGKS